MLAQHKHIQGHSLFNAIEEANRAGSLTIDESMLYKFYAVMDPSKLPGSFRAIQPEPLRCGTPLFTEFHQLRDQLRASTVSEIEALISQSATRPTETFTSPSGNFVIHYETSGEDAPPATDTSGVNGVPDYVEFVAAAADSSMRHQVQRLGFTDPILPSSPYDVTIKDLGPGFFGLTRSLGNTTEIEIHNDFLDGFPPNSHPDGDQIGAINATMAHEFKHAVQFANNSWQGSAGSFGWIEMDATLMEELTYDNVNDYYNVIFTDFSIFNAPDEPIPGGFWDVTWQLFFSEIIGPQFWVDVWGEIKQNPTMNFLNAIISQLNVRDQSFNQLFAQNHLWHYASGPDFSTPGFGFEERENYPNPEITATINGIQDSLDSARNISALAANYFRLLPFGDEPNQVLIRLNSNKMHIAAGAIAVFKDGSSDFLVSTSVSNSGIISLKTPWSWSEVDEIGIITVNTSQSESMTVNIGTASHQTTVTELDQNFPNPFRGATTIRFTLGENSHVELRIFDISGRLVNTLIDEERASGTHTITFESRKLASGVYFYQLITDEGALVKKMTLIK